MYNKPIKQMGAVQTNVVDPTNTPNVPQQFQTGSYYDPTQVVQNPPPPAINNQMGTYPMQQNNTLTETSERKKPEQGVKIVDPRKNTLKKIVDTAGSTTGVKTYSKEINTRPMTKEQLNNYNSAVNSYKDSTNNWVKGKGPEPKVPNYTNFKLTDSEKKIYNK